ncbi:uncharacterized protein [Apostichopus japonicus]|uniref:uncharacterized protein isoform X1 n=1 Tax=Stichopus japonicus TaxID=307972 RepID=UPI003AB4C992
MARLEVFLFLALVAVASTYQAPNWNNPLFIFQQYDSNRNGELEWNELFEMFHSFGKVKSVRRRRKFVKALTKMMMTYDRDRSGTLNRFEFSKAFPVYQDGNIMEMFG